MPVTSRASQILARLDSTSVEIEIRLLVTDSVGCDTVKLYHDTDADTFTGKVS